MARTNTEQRLKSDIGRKNVLSSRLFSRLHEARRYQAGAASTRSRRWQKKYASTAARLSKEIDALKKDVLALGADLEKRIQQEMKISEAEIRDFKARYEKELAEARAAAAKAKTAQEEWLLAESSFKSATKDEQKKLRELEAAAAKARAEAAKEQKDVDKAKREEKSEEHDKLLFRLELERISAERAAFAK